VLSAAIGPFCPRSTARQQIRQKLGVQLTNVPVFCGPPLRSGHALSRHSWPVRRNRLGREVGTGLPELTHPRCRRRHDIGDSRSLSLCRCLCRRQPVRFVQLADFMAHEVQRVRGPSVLGLLSGHSSALCARAFEPTPPAEASTTARHPPISGRRETGTPQRLRQPRCRAAAARADRPAAAGGPGRGNGARKGRGLASGQAAGHCGQRASGVAKAAKAWHIPRH
jgi:hypothetical protein